MTHKAQSVGMHLDIVSAARRINDRMAGFVADDVVKAMLRRGIAVSGAMVLVAGYTFKENCADIRNTKVTDLVNGLTAYSCDVTIFDPVASPKDVYAAYGHDILVDRPGGLYEAVILAVQHDEIVKHGANWRNLLIDGGLIYDIKGMLPASQSDVRL